MIKFRREHLAETVVRLKERENTTYRDIAKKVGISHSTIGRMGLGENYPDMESFLAVINYFGLDLCEFFEGAEYLNLSTLPANKKKRIQEILREQGSLSRVSDTE